jgi:hypothetical protein
MKMLRTILMIATTTLILASCKKSDTPGNPGDFFNCHIQQQWTQQSTFDYLVGKWQLIYASNSSGQLALENIILIFEDNGTLRVFKDGQPISTTSFGVIQFDAQTYGLYTSASSPYTDGRILFCGGEVEFNGSYTGGADHWFRKAQ